jgi:putative autotransporter adhesin-like protein
MIRAPRGAMLETFSRNRRAAVPAVPAPLHRGSTPHRDRLIVIATLVVFAIAAALVIVLAGTYTWSHPSGAQGSGRAASETRHVAAFRTVELAGGNNVTISVGRRQAVVVRGDDNLLHRVTTRVQGGSLVIGATGSFSTKAPMHVEVTMPSLRALTLSGSGTIVAEGVQTPRLGVTLSGSGTVRVSGSAGRLDAVLDGSGNLQLSQLVARDARAAVNASGLIMVNATHSLDAAVGGSGAIVYTGSPAHVTQSVSGSGAITEG